jgi:hypothetical protein
MKRMKLQEPPSLLQELPRERIRLTIVKDEGLELNPEKRTRAKLAYLESRGTYTGKHAEETALENIKKNKRAVMTIQQEATPVPVKDWPKGRHSFVEKPKQPMVAPMAPKNAPKFTKRDLMFPYTFDGPLDLHAQHLIQDSTWIANDYRNCFWSGMLYECAVVMKELYNAWQGEKDLNEKRIANQQEAQEANSKEIRERRAGYVKRGRG